jgi:hypothetical protein
MPSSSPAALFTPILVFVTTERSSVHIAQLMTGMRELQTSLLFVNCCIPLGPPLHNVNQSKGLVASEGYRVVIITNILVNRMARGT